MSLSNSGEEVVSRTSAPDAGDGATPGSGGEIRRQIRAGDQGFRGEGIGVDRWKDWSGEEEKPLCWVPSYGITVRWKMASFHSVAGGN